MARAKENHVFEFRKGGMVFERRYRLYYEDRQEKVNPNYIPTAAEIEERAAGGYRSYLDGKLYQPSKR